MVDVRDIRVASLPKGFTNTLGLHEFFWPDESGGMNYVNLNEMDFRPSKYRLGFGTWEGVPWGRAEMDNSFAGIIMSLSCLGLSWTVRGQTVTNNQTEARAYALRYLKDVTPEHLADAVNAFRRNCIGADKIAPANIQCIDNVVHYFTAKKRHYTWQEGEFKGYGTMTVDFRGLSQSTAQHYMRLFGLPQEVLKPIGT